MSLVFLYSFSVIILFLFNFKRDSISDCSRFLFKLDDIFLKTFLSFKSSFPFLIYSSLCDITIAFPLSA